MSFKVFYMDAPWRLESREARKLARYKRTVASCFVTSVLVVSIGGRPIVCIGVPQGSQVTIQTIGVHPEDVDSMQSTRNQEKTRFGTDS
jgi:hypothetical protein